jgi:hypothetical protein
VKFPSTTAKRHYCSAAINGDTAFSQFHTHGNGMPRSKACTYCRGALNVEEGYHCVVAWDANGVYRIGDAVKIFTSPAAAQRYADSRPQDVLVVRWIYADQAGRI